MGGDPDRERDPFLSVRVTATTALLPEQALHTPAWHEIAGRAIEPQPVFIHRRATYEDWVQDGGQESREDLDRQGFRYFYFYTTD